MIVSFPRVDGVSMISVAIKVLRTEPQLNGHTLMLTALRSTLVHTLKKKKEDEDHLIGHSKEKKVMADLILVSSFSF